MKKEILSIFFLMQILLFAQNDLNISFSEVMFSPLETNGEFIEIYNSSIDSFVNLSQFKIIYVTSKADTIIKLNGSTVLPPKSYVVIFENDYDFINGVYMNLVHDSTIVMQIDNGKFGSSGMANSSDRTIYLLNEIGDTLDTYTYSANNSAGISDEKIDVENKNNVNNWANSLIENGTPGYKNSVTPLDFDLESTSINYFPGEVFVEEEVEFRFKIKNRGEKKAELFEIKLFVDYNRDSVAQVEEIVFSKLESLLESKDSLEYSEVKQMLVQGEFNVFAKVIFDKDQKNENNLISQTLLIRPKPNEYADIVINEIMFKPKNDEPEWIEIFNRSGEAINIKEWRLSDRTSKPQICDSSYFIGDGEYLVLTEDETIKDFYDIDSKIIVVNLPSLNNMDDNLKLIDSLGRCIDSVSYSSEWGGDNGYSLERIDIEKDGNDSTNWKSSISKYFATPGEINSITPKEVDLIITEFKIENEYSVVGENLPTKIIVKNIGLTGVDNFVVSIFNDANLNSIAEDNERSYSIAGSTIEVGDSLLFEYNISQFIEGENRYIAKIELVSDNNKENNDQMLSFVGVVINEFRNDILINEIMHSPKSTEPEWIEIYNNCSKTINLKNYQVADNADTVKLIIDDVFIYPNNYLIVSDDSSFITVFEGVENYVIASFPNLNNSGDKVFILDSLSRVIDSLEYTSEFGGANGYSLERISSNRLSTDSTNWESSKIINGTPGRINSVSKKDFDIELVQLVFIPEIPSYGEDVKVEAKIRNVGKNNAEFRITLEELDVIDSTIIEEIEISEIIILASGDSINYQFTFVAENLTKERLFSFYSLEFNDQDTTNNYLQKSISPSIGKASIVVNEIMYSPSNGECEWVELFNCTNTPIDVKEFTISDIYTTPKTTIVSDSNLVIEPNEFLIIAKDSLLSEYHKELQCPIIVERFANLNNDIDGIVLKDRYGIIVDSVIYKNSWGGNNGYSFERKLSNGSSIDSTNWGSSTDIELSTPGRKNSITPFEYDLAITRIETIPEFPIVGDDINISVTVENIGLNSINNFNIEIEYLLNGKKESLDNIAGAELNIDDSIKIISDYSILLTDSIEVTAQLVSSLDENSINNFCTIVALPGVKKNSIIINEFLANPNSNEAEWIEICNISSRSYDISKWFVSDILTTPKVKQISETPIIIEENEYLVVSNDTSKISFNSNTQVVEVKFGTLGNRDDGIILYDFNMNVVDSLSYDKDWEIKKGRSLERLSSDIETSDNSNWLLSLTESGSSPGVSNSVLETEPAEEKSIIINEIMYDPKVGNSEFVEFYNNSDNPIDIGGWRLVDGSNNLYEISPTFLIVEANEYFVIASDSLIYNCYTNLKDSSNIKIIESNSFSFSNSGESLVVIDHWGNVIDSVFYNPNWNNKNIAELKNKSLERISSQLGSNETANWSTSVSKQGATPGMANSVLTENSTNNNGLTFNPNPFSPDNDGFEDFSIINYSLPFNTAQIRVKIFDDKGRLVRMLANNQAVSSNGAIVFDGLNDAGNALRIGMYIVFLEAVDTKSGNSISFKDVIVVARKL